MITLCMDTCHINLALCLIEDQTIIGRVQKPSWKRQSEEIFPCLMDMMDKAGKKPEDIDQVVITRGPGSYTGVRIAMTIAKVFCATRNRPLYTIGTLDLYAALTPDCVVLLDARGQRAYTARYRNGKRVTETAARYLKDMAPEIKEDDILIGDGHLLNRPDRIPDLAACFLASQPNWEKAENVHLVRPEYLKSSEAYRRVR